MGKEHLIISFDSDSWKDIKELLELGENLKCKYCDVIINKNNVGGISFPKNVFCENSICLMRHTQERNSRKAGDKRK